MSSRYTRWIWPRALKRLAPKSLFGRSLLIIVLPIALMQVAVTWFFFDAHWDAVTGLLSEGLAGDVAWISQAYDEAPTPARFDELQKKAQGLMELSIALQPGRDLPATRKSSRFGLDKPLNRALSEHLGAKLPYDTLEQLRAKLFADHPSFGQIDYVAPAAALDLKSVGGAGDVGDAAFACPVDDFYLTNPIARASVTMAECSALAAGRRAPLAAE